MDNKTSLFLKVLSLVLFLLSAMTWKKVLKSGAPNYHFIFYRVVITILIIFPLPLLINLLLPNNPYFNFKIPFEVHFIDWLGYIIIGLFSFWGLYFYTKALQSGRFSFVAPLATISVVFSFFTSIVCITKV